MKKAKAATTATLTAIKTQAMAITATTKAPTTKLTTANN